MEKITMTPAEISAAVQELREYSRMMAELEAMQEATRDRIKAAMAETGSDEIAGADYRITWKEITSTRLDTTAIKKAFPAEALAPYMKTSSARRFILT